MINTTLAELEESESKNRGRPFKYPTVFIVSALMLKFLFKLPYRTAGGLSHKPLPNTKIYHRALSMNQQTEKLLKDALIDVKSLQGLFQKW